MTYILVTDYLNRVERIRNGTASIGDVSIVNIQNEILGRCINPSVAFDCGKRMKQIKPPKLVLSFEKPDPFDPPIPPFDDDMIEEEDDEFD